MSDADRPNGEVVRAADSELIYATPGAIDVGTPAGAMPLTRYDFATLAIRLLGIYMLLEMLPSAIDAILKLVFYRQSSRVLLAYDSIVVVTYSIVGAVLVFKAPLIGSRLLPTLPVDRPDPLPSARASAVQLHAAALATCAIILLAFRGVPRLILNVWTYYNHPELRRPAIMAESIIDTLVGLFLFFGASGIAAYWDRIREPRSDSDR